MGTYVDPLAVTRTTGPDIAVDPTTGMPYPVSPSFAVQPKPAVDPNNPLGLTAAAPGYLPPDQRAPQRDPDLGWSDNMGPQGGPILATADSLSPDLRNQVNQAEIDWGNMDEAYWKPREQNPLPLVLGAAGLIAAPFALSALGIGGAAGAAGGAGSAGTVGGGLGSVGSTLGSVGGALGGGAGLGAAGTAAGVGAGALGANTVAELVVTAAAQGLSVPAIAASLGIPAATAASILSSGGSGTNALQGSQGNDTLSTATSPPNEVAPITVTAPATSGINPALVAGVGAAGLGTIGALTSGGSTPVNATAGPQITPPSTPATGPLTTPPTTPFTNAPPSLLQAIKSGDLSSVGNWITANPLQAVQLGLLSASALSAVTGAGTPSNSASGTYTPVTLPASFTATSPHFVLAGRGDPRTMPAQDWTKYGQGPEQSFFTGINQPAPITDLTVAKPLKRAHGGFAVKGAGDGRSDSIDARLSDGEYVMDAETVALLGNGSNKAGADKLDQFRVNLRKDKGRNLARGDFSVEAKAPIAYMAGGR